MSDYRVIDKRTGECVGTVRIAAGSKIGFVAPAGSTLPSDTSRDDLRRQGLETAVEDGIINEEETEHHDICPYSDSEGS